MLTSARDECLTFMNDHIPTWLILLINLSEGTECRQINAPDTPGSATLLSDRNITKLNTPNDSSCVGTVALTSNAYGQRSDGIQPFTGAKRKRRSSSVETQHEVGCNRYRAQNAKVVLYDASAQQTLERVVDALTKAKNLIRKAKAQARMQNMCRRSSSGSDDDDEDDLDDDTVMAQVRLRRRRTTDVNTSSGSEGSATFNIESLDKVDMRLGRAQDLCTTAAYQLLRDGDCSAEASSASEQLAQALTLVREETASIEDRSISGSLGGSFSHSPIFEKGMRASVDSIDDHPLIPGPLMHEFMTVHESF